MPDDPIVYRYQESKARPILGLESKSFTQAEYDALTPQQRGQVVRSGFWTRLEPKSDSKPAKSAEKGES